MKNFTKHIITVIFGLSLALTTTQARWATPEEAPVEYDLYSRTITTQADGRSEEVVEQQIKIINETGRNEFGTQRMYYNGNIEEIEIIEAKTVIDGKEYKVAPEMIETKPLASPISGFDQMFQVLISYPQAAPGSTLYLKYKTIIKKQPLPNYYDNNFFFGREGVWKKSKVTLKSKLPLNIKVNDPNKVLKVKESKDKDFQILEIDLQKPIYAAVINELHSNIPPLEKLTWVTVSTLKEYTEMGKAFNPGFETVIGQPLPPLFVEIKEAAAKLDNPSDQINKVTSLLAERIRYMGDWRSIEGRFAPRALEAIATSGVGDCKDFSAATAAILNALGFDAHAILVTRGLQYFKDIETLPVVGDFNHAMTKVIDKNGIVYWIDPTNQTSMADGIFPDISNRPALVLNGDKSTYEKIPAVDYKRALFENTSTITLKGDDTISASGEVSLKGEDALMLTGATLTTSKQTVEEFLILQLSGEVTPLAKSTELPDLNSRIRTDLKVKYSYEQKNNLLYTNAGSGLFLDSSWAGNYSSVEDNQVGTCFMGVPRTITKKLFVKGIKVNEVTLLNFSISTPWIDSKRTCQAQADGVEIIEETVIKASYITAKEIHSQAYKDLKENIKKYCTKVALVFAKP